jgi:hypothetical protein
MHWAWVQSPQLSSQFGDHAGRSRATLVDLMNRAVQFGKQKGPRPDTRIRTQGQSVVDYLMGQRAS